LKNCNGLKRARRKTGTEWHISGSFVSWLWFNGWKHKYDEEMFRELH